MNIAMFCFTYIASVDHASIKMHSSMYVKILIILHFDSADRFLSFMEVRISSDKGCIASPARIAVASLNFL